MIAEFYGLPGTGKTTTILNACNSISEFQLITEGKTISKVKLIKNMFTVEFIRFLFLSFGLWLRKKKRYPEDKAIIVFMVKTFLKYMSLRGQTNSVVEFNDHGIIQCLVSFVWDDVDLKKNIEPIENYIFSLFKNEVCWVYAHNDSITEVIDRIDKREAVRRVKNMEYKEKYALLQLQEELFERAFLTSNNICKALQLDTNTNIDDNVVKLKENLIP